MGGGSAGRASLWREDVQGGFGGRVWSKGVKEGFGRTVEVEGSFGRRVWREGVKVHRERLATLQ